MSTDPLQRDFSRTLTIKAPADAILQAFFDHDLLAYWWHVRHSLCTPRTLGCYAVEWEPTEWRDDLLGRLGGVFHGTVMTFDPRREFLIADAYWLAPDSDPVGPMALEVRCAPAGSTTIVHVRQSGSDVDPRWVRYYGYLAAGFDTSLARLKSRLDR